MDASAVSDAAPLPGAQTGRDQKECGGLQDLEVGGARVTQKIAFLISVKNAFCFFISLPFSHQKFNTAKSKAWVHFFSVFNYNPFPLLSFIF